MSEWAEISDAECNHEFHGRPLQAVGQRRFAAHGREG